MLKHENGMEMPPNQKLPDEVIADFENLGFADALIVPDHGGQHRRFEDQLHRRPQVLGVSAASGRSSCNQR